jgi:hypothetical protein
MRRSVVLACTALLLSFVYSGTPTVRRWQSIPRHHEPAGGCVVTGRAARHAHWPRQPPSTSELLHIDPPWTWGVRGIDGPIRAAVDVLVKPVTGPLSAALVGRREQPAVPGLALARNEPVGNRRWRRSRRAGRPLPRVTPGGPGRARNAGRDELPAGPGGGRHHLPATELRAMSQTGHPGNAGKRPAGCSEVQRALAPPGSRQYARRPG